MALTLVTVPMKRRGRLAADAPVGEDGKKIAPTFDIQGLPVNDSGKVAPIAESERNLPNFLSLFGGDIESIFKFLEYGYNRWQASLIAGTDDDTPDEFDVFFTEHPEYLGLKFPKLTGEALDKKVSSLRRQVSTTAANSLELAGRKMTVTELLANSLASVTPKPVAE